MLNVSQTVKSWKTTLAAFLTFAAMVVGVIVTWLKTGDLSMEAISTAVTALLAAVGLLFAKDGDKTSEDLQLKQ